jgi:hypothetical protein
LTRRRRVKLRHHGGLLTFALFTPVGLLTFALFTPVQCFPSLRPTPYSSQVVPRSEPMPGKADSRVRHYDANYGNFRTEL